MPRLKLIVEYDGTDYVGWQVQRNGPSIQAALETALSTLLEEPVSVRGAGRTDAGVHALGQVVSFRTERELPLVAYERGLNGLLPRDIAVVEASVVPDAFDPRHWSIGKRYRYQLSNRRTRSPLRRRTHWEIYNPLDRAAMQAAARHWLGRHDFSAFRASDCQAAHALREITGFEVISRGPDELWLEVSGTAFLKHMVRNLTGTLVEIGRGRRAPEWAAEVLASRDRKLAGQTAPPQGLFLVEVFFGAGPRSSRPEAGAEADEDG